MKSVVGVTRQPATLNSSSRHWINKASEKNGNAPRQTINFDLCVSFVPFVVNTIFAFCVSSVSHIISILHALARVQCEIVMVNGSTLSESNFVNWKFCITNFRSAICKVDGAKYIYCWPRLKNRLIVRMHFLYFHLLSEAIAHCSLGWWRNCATIASAAEFCISFYWFS